MTNVTVPGSYSLDEYVWLGGRPVAVSRATFALMSGFAHRYNDSLPGASCTRNGDNVPCGFYFPVTDALGSPVVMLDANGRVTGANDGDPFGYPNRGQVSAKTAQPYADSQSAVSLGTYQLASAGTSVPVSTDTRVKFAVLEILPDGGDGVFLKSGSASTPFLAGQPGAPAWTAWLPLDAGTSTVSVLFTSNASGHTDGGAVAEAFEYRRYQTSAASPFFISGRFPGQYHDSETDLFENWNRYYDPFTGRYLEPERLLSLVSGVQDVELANLFAHNLQAGPMRSPIAMVAGVKSAIPASQITVGVSAMGGGSFVVEKATVGHSVSTYSYALNDPLNFYDSNGLEPTSGGASLSSFPDSPSRNGDPCPPQAKASPPREIFCLLAQQIYYWGCVKHGGDIEICLLTSLAIYKTCSGGANPIPN